MRAICAVINKIRIAKGWSVLNASDAEIHAMVWLEVLNAAKVPHNAYDALYQRAMQAKARKLSMGDKDFELTPEFLVSMWLGEHGLGEELKRQEKRTALSQNAESICGHCYGSGFRVMEMNDGYTGAMKCDHMD